MQHDITGPGKGGFSGTLKKLIIYSSFDRVSVKKGNIYQILSLLNFTE